MLRYCCGFLAREEQNSTTMSDVEFSGTDSDPVSDVNPEEMARLMADIDEIDDNLFKSNLKSTSKAGSSNGKATSPDKKEAKRQVTFSEKQVPRKGDDDDWDGDDLLYSDDDAKSPGKPAKKPQSPGKPSSPANKNVDTGQRTKDKKKLMAELFSDESPGKAKSPETSESPGVTAPRRDKKKLMSELFGGDDDASKSNLSPGNTTQRPVSGRKENKSNKKITDESIFADDSADLLGDIGDTQRRPSTSPKGESFLNSLLSKSSASEKPRRGKPSEFVLDDKYKNMDKQEAPSSGGFQGYTPSASKPGSPRRTSSKSPARDSMDFDFLGDAQPRRRGSKSAPQRKPFEIDDDDILGNVRSHRRGNKEITGDPSPNKRASSAPGTQKESSRAGRKDDWLFGDSGEASETMKRNIDESTVTASVEKSATSPQKSPSQDQDWLGDLLSTNKKSPAGAKQHQGQGSPADPGNPNLASQVPATHLTPPTPAAGSGPSKGAGVAPPNPAVPHPPAVAAPYTSAPLSAPAEDMQNRPQSLLLMQQQQQQEAQAAAFAAQVKSQQEQLSSQMTQQLHQQQQLMAELLRKQQEAANKSYQDSVSTMGQFALAPPALQGNTTTEQQKNIEVNLKEAEAEAAKARAELDLIRKHHEQEVAVLEKSHKRQLEVEREMWGRVETRLREERDSLLSDFQNKLSLLQEEKKSLSASYQIQLSGVKEEWSQALERTKELYAGMLDRVKEEHSAALQRVMHLKDLELKAAVAASGHVK